MFVEGAKAASPDCPDSSRSLSGLLGSAGLSRISAPCGQMDTLAGLQFLRAAWCNKLVVQSHQALPLAS
jgi:hypothetical protein